MSTDNQLIEGDKNAYSSTAEMHADKHPFPVGRWFAENLGCPSELLDSLQSSAVDVFTGVSNVSVFAEIPIWSTVLDLGCGAGLYLLIAAKSVGPKGKVIGIDFSNTMLSRARQDLDKGGKIEQIVTTL